MGNLEGKRWRTGRYSGSGIMLILLYQLSPSSAISPSFYTITMPPHLGSIIHSGATREESRDNSALHCRWQHLGLRQGVCIAEARPPPKTHHEDFPPRDLFRRLPEGWRAPIINAWASLLAGLVAYTIATPIEAFKVGMQTWPASTFQSIGQKILKSRGPLGFFNALDAMLWAGIPYSVIMYGCYQPVKKFVNEKMREAGLEPGAIGQFLGAAVAETLGEIVFVPGELVRIRMMSEPGRYSSFLQVSKCFDMSKTWVRCVHKPYCFPSVYTRLCTHGVMFCACVVCMCACVVYGVWWPTGGAGYHQSRGRTEHVPRLLHNARARHPVHRPHLRPL